ncbi:RNA degradosome polyphosphate kinase [Eremococcus coleocola]|uniref:RNA degradosome polyphosphate kinase n=1 Tax=Eremococcus coleocola TaxID=88132 RepID=UPI000422B811|nr:RNA degradosome polyphosphate kinase [Eremococcus coleocola]
MPASNNSKKAVLKKSFTATDFSNTNFSAAKYYFNRELSWLDFNDRVLDQASDLNNPYLEQLNFIAIASSNLDEFFMVRVAGVYDQFNANVEIAENKTRMTPKELLNAIADKNHNNITKQYDRYQQLVKALPKYGVALSQVAQLDEEERLEADRYFNDFVLPTLSPLGVDAYRPFPHLNNKALNIFVSLSKEGEDHLALIPVPALLDRLILLKAHQTPHRYLFIEDLIISHLDKLFIGYSINYAYPFRITRSADFDIIEDNAEDLLELMEDYVKQRRNGFAVRLELDSSYDADYQEDHIDFLKDRLNMKKRDIYPINGPLDLTFLFDFIETLRDQHPEASYPPFTPYLNPDHQGQSLFEAIRKKDLFFNHPYDSFDPIVNLVQEAAEDEETISIKQTLYRVSKHSPIIAALKKAAENGKEVTVLVELKARFDEENNVYWARELEDAGCHVLYGVSELKTHSKITLIIRKEADRIRRYVHLGTGNYNDKTAKIYTDMGIMSAKDELTQDASNFFNFLSGYSERPQYKHLHVSPFEIRDSLQDYIEDEIKFQQEYGNGQIIAKMNSLTDKQLIKTLYEASQAGVQIDLIIRGICCLKPGVPGVSENIRVRSIVGRFLEHSRVYFFNRNGHHHLFLSSADMMTRNMIKRVEIEFPILDKEIEDTIIDILKLQLSDTLKARILQTDGTYVRPDASEIQVNAQEIQLAQAQKAQETQVKEVMQIKENKSWFERILQRFR